MVTPTQLPFFRPFVGQREIDAVAMCLRSGWLTTGPLTRKFEEAFAEYVGVAHAVAVNSCTAAMHLSLEACGIGKLDEVIVPTLTFVATAQAVLYAGAIPVLVDCRRDTLTIDPDAIEAAITPHTRAIIIMHYGGHPCDLDRIGQIARAHNLVVVEDAAHVIHGSYHGSMIGASGNPTCFSFHATKPFTTGEGGMVTTPNSTLATKIRLLRTHAIRRDAWTRGATHDPWEYDVDGLGYKCNMSDIMAAIGLAQLESVAEQHERRTIIAQQYIEAFGGRADVILQQLQPSIVHAWHLFPLLLRLERLTVDRATIMRELLAKGIVTAIHYRPLHLFSSLASHYRMGSRCLENSEWAYERLITLPLYSALRDEDVQRVAESVIELLDQFRR